LIFNNLEYICIIMKKIQILLPAYLITFLIFIFLSCKDIEKKKLITFLKTEKGILPLMVINDSVEPLTESFISKKKKEIQSFSEKNWPNKSMNGGFLVAKNGVIIYEDYNGFASFEKKTIIDSVTPLHIASVSKVLTATAILKLIDAKKLELDQKLNTILPTFPFPDVTIKTLLNHRSGLKNYAYFTNKKPIWDSKIILKNSDILDILATNKVPLESKTDTKFSYSNTNYALLALVIEKITGFSYPEAMQKMIFTPLKMNHTFVFDLEKDKETATPSYKKNNTKYALDFLDGVYGDKNIFSTPRDLLKFDLARRSNHFLSPELEQKVYEGYSNEHKGTKNYGLGIRMILWETGQKYYFHNGWWHGNTSSFITLGKERLTIISLSNKFNHATYKVKNLSPLFGDYPFKVEDSIQ
jgi:CubicO group peptidase (beta-lactamase class C family)